MIEQPDIAAMFAPMSAPAALRARRARPLEAIALVLQGALALCTGYLLLLLAAARRASGVETQAAGGERTRFVILVPAHDEESGIRATLASLVTCDYPQERRRVIVIADNCTDLTAALAEQAGVEVWERVDRDRRGKGFALIWALERLAGTALEYDAVAVVDADCVASANMLAAMDATLRDGADAVQVSYLVGNPGDSHVSALRYAAFSSMATVRPLGKQRLGFSAGLFGTGMAFTRALLREQPWSATGLVEDFEYHLRLVHSGRRVAFISSASVRSAMPTTFAGSADQQARWEKGKLQIVRNWTPRLIARGVARRDLARVHAGVEQLVPPQSLIAAGSGVFALTATILRSPRLLVLSLATIAAQLVFVLGGLRLVGAPAQAYRGLLAAPALILRKLALYVRLLMRGGPSGWVRTERQVLASTEVELAPVFPINGNVKAIRSSQ